MRSAEELLRQFSLMETDRGVLDEHLEEIAERVLPRQAEFVTQRTAGEKRTAKIFDSTPQIALERSGAVLDSVLTPRQQTWHGLRHPDPEVNRVFEVQGWFEAATRTMFTARYAPSANFASQNFERWISVMAFGTGALFTDYFPGTGLRYRVVHLKNLYFALNHQGIIDTVFRRFQFTARQAAQRWGKENLSEEMQKCLDSNDPKKQMQEFPIVHVVMPREDYDPEKIDSRSMPWASIYIDRKAKETLSESGYTSFPYSISRYVTAPEEIYGRSPAMTALPDIRMLNEMSKTNLRALHKLADPPLLINDDGILGGGSRAVDLRPGGLTMGGVDSQGRQLVHPLQTGARVDLNEIEMENRRRRIDDSFLVTLFQILTENPRMTATEALIRAQEKGMLLAPTMGRQQSEALGPQIERELDLLIRNGVIPEPPPELIEAGGDYEIIYDSPMSRMQRAEELVGVQRTMELLAPFAQIDPTILDIFDKPKLARLTAEVSGVPVSVLRSDEDIEAERQARAQQQEMQMALESAQPVAGALRDVAQAQKFARGG